MSPNEKVTTKSRFPHAGGGGAVTPIAVYTVPRTASATRARGRSRRARGQRGPRRCPTAHGPHACIPRHAALGTYWAPVHSFPHPSSSLIDPSLETLSLQQLYAWLYSMYGYLTKCGPKPTAAHQSQATARERASRYASAHATSLARSKSVCSHSTCNSSILRDRTRVRGPG